MSGGDQLDPQHVWEVADPASAAHQAALQVNRLAGVAAVVPDPVPPDMQQRVLSSFVDAGALAQLVDPVRADLGFRSHMSLLQLDGASGAHVKNLYLRQEVA